MNSGADNRPSDTAPCPDCGGDPRFRTTAFVNTGPDSSKHRCELRPCYRCNGSGAVSFEMLAWIVDGRRMRDARVARGESTFQCADRRGISPALLSAMEHGRTKPIPETPHD